MPIFTVEIINELPPQPAEPFYKLLVDGKCHIDVFCAKM
jgi:hypothetical protein